MNTEMLSETQKRIVNQELFRKLVLNEVKTRVSKKDYNIIVENYNLLLQHHISGPDILSEGVKDLFINMIQGIKKLGDKLNPDDEKLVLKLEAELESLIIQSSDLREQYVNYKETQKEVDAQTDGKADTSASVKIEKIRIQAEKLDKKSRQIAERINIIRKKYNLEPIEYEIPGVPADQQNDNIPDIIQGGEGGAAPAPKGGQSKKQAGIPPEVKKVAGEFENEKAPGIFSSIINSYKYAFGANAAMWKGLYKGFSQAERAPAPRQDDILLKILAMLIAQADKKGTPVPSNIEDAAEKAKEEVNDDEEGGEGEEEGKRKQNTVKGIQDKIILAINKVFDTKNVDISRKDTMELAKKITQNIVDQLRANDVQFKGLKESIEKEVLFILEGKVSQRFAGGKSEKYMKPVTFVKTLEKVRKFHYKTLNLNDTNKFEEYKNSEEDQEWMGFYGHYLDLKKLKSIEGKVLKAIDKEGNKSGQILKNKIKEKGKSIGAMLKKFQLYYRDRDTPEQKKRYRELLKKTSRERLGGKDAKDMYKPEKVKTFDLPKGKKGQINVKNLIFQALKGLNMDSEQVQDIESLLNKRLQSVVKQYIEKGMDVKVLEEKINRHLDKTVRILNNGM